MSLITGLLRAALPVGSARRDRLLGLARKGGVLPPAPESSYQRWITTFEHSIPTQIDELVASNSLRFIVVVHPGASDPAGVTRTLVSLVNQSYPLWTAHLPDSADLHVAARRVFVDSLAAEARFTISAPLTPPEAFVLHLDLGDAIAPDALSHFAATANRYSQASLITAEFDMIDPISGRRSAPAAVGSWEPDLAQQFDLFAGCVVRKGDLSGNNEPAASLQPSTSPHINSVLLHRLVGVRSRSTSLLPPGRPARAEGSPGSFPGSFPGSSSGSSSGSSPGSSASTRRNGGTRVRHSVVPGTTVALLVRDPLPDRVAAQSHLAALLNSAGSQCEVVTTGTFDTKGGLLAIPTADVVVIIDGGLAPQENGWLDDVVGTLMRPHVFAVAPVVVVPSGVVLDAGIRSTTDGLAARSGRTDLAPFELERCRQVTSLSGRSLAIRRDDFVGLLADEQVVWGSSFSASLAAVTAASGRCCLVWAHQRWTLARGLDAGPTDSPMLAWSRGRIATWFDSGITPHQPEPGRAGEGVW